MSRKKVGVLFGMALLSVVALGACAPQVGMHSALELPQGAAKTCTAQCEQLGLVFDGVAIVGVAVACICRPAGAPVVTTVGETSSRRARGATVLLTNSEDMEPVLDL